MKNLIHQHPSPDVRAAAIRLLDALTTWNRTTSRENVVIIKDTVGCEIRMLSGSPPPERVTDAELLEAFEALCVIQPPFEG